MVLQRPPVARRVAVAVGVACAAAFVAWFKSSRPDSGFVPDFGYFWRAAGVVAQGLDPYREMLFVYPITSAVALAPLAWLPMVTAGVVFVGASFGLLAFAVTRDGFSRLPMLMSFPALWSASAGQWAPLVTCAALGTAYAWVAPLKPTLGAVMLARRLDWKGAIIAAVIGLATLVAYPTWPLDWVRAMSTFSGAKLHHIPVAVLPAGPLLLLAALRWKSEDGRLLLGMALIPQSMFVYDQLALLLLARSFRESLVFALWSYLAMFVAFMLSPSTLGDDKAANAAYFARAVVLCYYLPALSVVLWRKPRDAMVGVRGARALWHRPDDREGGRHLARAIRPDDGRRTSQVG